MPILLAGAVCAAVGESLGYLLGEGNSSMALTHWEVHAEKRLEA